MKKIFAFAIVCFTLCASIQANAQAPSLDDIKAQLVKDWERAKDYTIAYLNTMPANKYSFKAVDSIRSFAQQMLHLAQANLFFMSLATDLKSPSFGSDREQSATAQTKDSVMYYVTTSYDYCINAIKSSDVSKWGKKEKLPFAVMRKQDLHCYLKQ